MLIRLVQAATSRVGKMLGNIMDSGAMKVVSTPAYITLFFVLILTGSVTITVPPVTITVPPGCPYCVFNCVCPDQHPQLHLLPQQRDQDRGIWLESAEWLLFGLPGLMNRWYMYNTSIKNEFSENPHPYTSVTCDITQHTCMKIVDISQNE